MLKQFLSVCFLIVSWLTGNAQTDQLQFYVERALHNSPLLKDYQNQVAMNKYDSLLIRASFKPQVNGSSINNYAPTTHGWGYDAAITNGGAFATLIGVNQALPNKKNLQSQFENIALQNQSIRNISQVTEQDLKRSIVAQYITAEGSLEQLNVNKEISSLLAKEEVILKKLTQSNVYRQVDYLAFLVTLQQQDLLVKQLTIQYRNDFNSLKYLCGITDTASVLLQSPAISLKPIPTINQSIYLKQFTIDSLKLINNKRLADIIYRPKVNLYADAGFNSTLAYHAYKNIGTSVGFSLIISIYDGQQKKIQYSKIDIQEKTRANYKTFFVNQYQQQITQLHQQLNETEDLISDISKQLKYTQSLIDVNRKLLQAGEAKITDYILAINNYINANNLITQNNISRLQIINQLNYWNR